MEGNVLSSPLGFGSGGDNPDTVPPVPKVNDAAASWMINPETGRGELKCEAHSSSSMLVGGDADTGGAKGGLLAAKGLLIR